MGEAPLEDAHIHGGGAAPRGGEPDERRGGGAGAEEERATSAELEAHGGSSGGRLCGGSERVDRRGQCCRGASFGMQGRGRGRFGGATLARGCGGEVRDVESDTERGGRKVAGCGPPRGRCPPAYVAQIEPPRHGELPRCRGAPAALTSSAPRHTGGRQTRARPAPVRPHPCGRDSSVDSARAWTRAPPCPIDAGSASDAPARFERFCWQRGPCMGHREL